MAGGARIEAEASRCGRASGFSRRRRQLAHRLSREPTRQRIAPHALGACHQVSRCRFRGRTDHRVGRCPPPASPVGLPRAQCTPQSVINGGEARCGSRRGSLVDGVDVDSRGGEAGGVLQVSRLRFLWAALSSTSSMSNDHSSRLRLISDAETRHRERAHQDVASYLAPTDTPSSTGYQPGPRTRALRSRS